MYELIKTLFPYLIILYLFEGITYVSTYHLLFVSTFGKNFKIIRAASYFFYILPLGEMVATSKLSLCFTPSGLYFPKPEQDYNPVLYNVEDFTCVPFTEINSIDADGLKITINGTSILKMSSTEEAIRAVTFIRELKNLPWEDRLKKIKTNFNATTNLEAVNTLKEKYTPWLFLLKICATQLFTTLFVLLPIALYVIRLQPYLNFTRVLLVITINYFLTIIIAAFVRYKIYRPSLGKLTTDTIAAILSPATVIQYPGYITKGLYVQFDYLTIAAAFLSVADFKTLMREALYGTDQALRQSTNEDWHLFWELLEKKLKELLTQTGLNKAKIFAPPVKEDDLSAMYCPVCLAQYRAEATWCQDCNIALTKF